MTAARNRLPAQIAGVLAAGLLLAVLLFRFAVYEPQRAAAPAIPAQQRPGPVQAVVVSVEGEVQRGGADGAWSEVRVGQTVQADELLRTGANARTKLAVDPRSRMTIEESSEVSIRELTDMVHRFRLTRGRMTAEYEREGERTLRVEDGAGEALAESKAARFSVLSTGTGIAVASLAGTVEVSARQRTVHIGPGQQAFVPRGAAPLMPVPIPTAVLLKVANALSGASSGLCAEIDGAAQPGAEIRVDGVPVQAGPDGRFRHEVSRARGLRGVTVSTRDAAGHTRNRTVPCSPAPAAIDDMAIRWREAP